MTFEFNALYFFRLLSGLFAIVLVIGLWKKKDSEAVLFLIFFELAASLWAITDGLEHSAETLSSKILWSQIGYIGSSTTSVFFLLFTFAYVQFHRYLHPFLITALMLIPAVTILLVFTSSHHQLIWTSVVFDPITYESTYNYGKWFWFFAFYEYSVLLTGITILLYCTFKFYKIYKIQLIYLIIASVLPLFTSLIYVFKLLPIKADLTPMALIFSGIFSALAIYYQKMLDVVPVARRQTINNLGDGVVQISKCRGCVFRTHVQHRLCLRLHGGHLFRITLEDPGFVSLSGFCLFFYAAFMVRSPIRPRRSLPDTGAICARRAVVRNGHI